MSGTRSADGACLHAVRAVDGKQAPLVDAMPAKPLMCAGQQWKQSTWSHGGDRLPPAVSTPWAETWGFLGSPNPEGTFSILLPFFSGLQKFAIYNTKGKTCEQCCQCIIIRTSVPKQSHGVTKLCVFEVTKAQAAVSAMHSNLNQVPKTVIWDD